MRKICANPFNPLPIPPQSPPTRSNHSATPPLLAFLLPTCTRFLVISLPIPASQQPHSITRNNPCQSPANPPGKHCQSRFAPRNLSGVDWQGIGGDWLVLLQGLTGDWRGFAGMVRGLAMQGLVRLGRDCFGDWQEIGSDCCRDSQGIRGD